MSTNSTARTHLPVTDNSFRCVRHSSGEGPPYWISIALATVLLALGTGCEKSAASASSPTVSPSVSPASTAVTGPLAAAAAYKIGETIQFGIGGGSERFRSGGWSDTEKDFTWSIGPSAKLLLSAGRNEGPLDLRVRMLSLIKPPELVDQPVEVLANDQKIADWRVGVTGDFAATIPAGTIKEDGLLKIEFKTPKAISPKALGLSEDPRVLGVRVSEIVITKNG